RPLEGRAYDRAPDEHRSRAHGDGFTDRGFGAPRAVSRRAADDGAVVSTAGRRRPRRAGHARCEPDQVAPGSRLLVLRDVPARAASAGLRPAGPRLSGPLQFLLQRCRPAVLATGPGPSLASP